MENYQVLQDMKPEELQELLNIYRAKNEGLTLGGQLHKPVMVNTMEESLLASLPNTSGRIDPMTGLRSFEDDNGNGNGDDGGGDDWGGEGYGDYESDLQDTFGMDTRSEIEKHHDAYLKSQEGQKDNGGQQQPPPPPPPKFKDQFGNEYATKAEADAANDSIKSQQNSFKNYLKTSIQSDTDFETFLVKINELSSDAGLETATSVKDKYYDLLPESELEKLFNEQKKLKVETSQTEIPQFIEALNAAIAANPTKTMEEIIVIAAPAGVYGSISSAHRAELYKMARESFDRKEAFTLTPEEVAEFARPDRVPIIATANNFTEWWQSKGGIQGQYKTEAEAQVAWQAAQIADAATVSIDTITEATAPTVTATTDVTAPTLDVVGDITADTVETVDVGTVAEAPKVTVETITGVNIDDLTAVDNFNDIITKLEARIAGETTSPAELQLKTATETNMKQLLGATAGAQADPSRVRQLRNLWAEMQQAATGQASELRSQETIAAENALIAVAKEKGSLELQVELANLETRRQTALKNADMENVRNISIMQMNLARVIAQAEADVERTTTQAEIETRTRIANLEKEIRMATEKGQLELAADLSNQKTTLQTNIAQADVNLKTALANLEARRSKAVEEGKIDLALSVANLEKDVILAKVNSAMVLDAMALDDAIALAAFKGVQNLYTIETQIDLAQLDRDLKVMGFEFNDKWENASNETKRYIANLTKQYKDAENDTDRQGIFFNMISTGLAAYAKWNASGLPGSDIRMKKNISSGDREIEQFLDAIDAYQYEYKDPNQPGADSGLLIGIMAQDAERGGPMGNAMVTPGPHGKMLDSGHGMAAVLAAQANLHKRTKQLEGRA